MMDKVGLDLYDYMPEEMKAYLRHYGWHFNKKMCDFATSKMKKNGKTIVPFTKENVEEMLRANNIKLENNQLHDAVFVANMARADYYGSSLTTDIQLANFVKDYIDDEDAPDGNAFVRWYATCTRAGIAVPWEDVL